MQWLLPACGLNNWCLDCLGIHGHKKVFPFAFSNMLLESWIDLLSITIARSSYLVQRRYSRTTFCHSVLLLWPIKSSFPLNWFSSSIICNVRLFICITASFQPHPPTVRTFSHKTLFWEHLYLRCLSGHSVSKMTLHNFMLHGSIGSVCLS